MQYQVQRPVFCLDFPPNTYDDINDAIEKIDHFLHHQNGCTSNGSFIDLSNPIYNACVQAANRMSGTTGIGIIGTILPPSECKYCFGKFMEFDVFMGENVVANDTWNVLGQAINTYNAKVGNPNSLCYNNVFGIYMMLHRLDLYLSIGLMSHKISKIIMNYFTYLFNIHNNEVKGDFGTTKLGFESNLKPEHISMIRATLVWFGCFPLLPKKYISDLEFRFFPIMAQFLGGISKEYLEEVSVSYEKVLKKNKALIDRLQPGNSVDLFDVVPYNFCGKPLVNIPVSDEDTVSDPTRLILKLYVRAKSNNATKAFFESQLYVPHKAEFLKALAIHNENIKNYYERLQAKNQVPSFKKASGSIKSDKAGDSSESDDFVEVKPSKPTKQDNRNDKHNKHDDRPPTKNAGKPITRRYGDTDKNAGKHDRYVSKWTSDRQDDKSTSKRTDWQTDKRAAKQTDQVDSGQHFEHRRQGGRGASRGSFRGGRGSLRNNHDWCRQ